jgi:hypothetical protein
MTEEELSNYAWMQIHRSRYSHDPALAARLDQRYLFGRGRGVRYSPMRTSSPTGATAAIAQERIRRGLTFPDDWISVGLRTPEEDF